MNARAHWSTALVTAGACKNAVAWARRQPTATAAWAACERADWMLWLAAKLSSTEARRREIVRAACACARTALVHVPEGELRPLRCIETAEAWCRGEASIEAVRTAVDGAVNAAYAVDDAAYAVDAAVNAAYAAYAGTAANIGDAAANIGDAVAAAAAYAVDAAVARPAALRNMAVLVREMLTMPEVST